MTKETFEKAKELDGKVSSINKAINALNGFVNPQVTVSSSISGLQFKFNELDTFTHDQLLAAMMDVLSKRKIYLINKLEEL